MRRLVEWKTTAAFPRRTITRFARSGSDWSGTASIASTSMPALTAVGSVISTTVTAGRASELDSAGAIFAICGFPIDGSVAPADTRSGLPPE